MARTNRFATTSEISMNHPDTSSCTCIQCPGSACACGCQHGGTGDLQAGAACGCAAGCGCEGAEAGCLCGTTQAAD
jgi:hypothetical protein